MQNLFMILMKYLGLNKKCGLFILLFSISVCCFSFQKLNRDINNNDLKEIEEHNPLPETIYEEWRISPKPANDVIVGQNPTALLWKSEKHWNNKEVTYKVYLSQDKNFSKENTFVSSEQKYCFFNPHKKLASGKWFWRYDIIDEDVIIVGKVNSFIVDQNSMIFETPNITELLSRIPKSHPRIINQGKNIDSIRLKAKSHRIYKTLIDLGLKVMKSEIYRGPVDDPDPAKGKAISIITSKEIGYFNRLLEAYVLSGDKNMLDNLLERTEVFLGWPTDDLLGSQVLMSLSTGYDVLYDELSDVFKKKMLAVIKNQLVHGLKKWPGLMETRQVENHFWQMEVAGNFTAALATIKDLDESREMLEYMYELFLARFPNLANQEGGWAEGIGYFGVNKSSIIDMPLLLKKVCGVDIFKMNWYKNLADYYIYFAPVGGRISGFGDMHDRVVDGNVGHSMMMIVGYENEDKKALYRLGALLTWNKTTNEKENWFEDKLESIEPWYQIINSIQLDSTIVEKPKKMPSSKLFKGVGIAALHTNVLESEVNTAVYFRSSPFGAKGHMHANQNCFNLSRKGEPVFYSTGYYTTFADPHSLTSYRHTRAHNDILVNGMGQAFGHEGYGWIKRFIDGKRISYVCGDASKAYRPIVDKQFIELNMQNGINPDELKSGFGDAKLKTFERHLIFVKPNIVITYDVLESENESDWSLLLHCMKEPKEITDNSLKLVLDKSYVEASVFGSSATKLLITDQFYSPAIDIKKKYKSLPNQYHITSKTIEKTKKMRFLTIIRLGDKSSEISNFKVVNESVFQLGDIVLKAELNVDKSPSISIITDQDAFYINKLPEGTYENKVVLIEKNGSKKKMY
ncbi:DUF4962 domain-containing protein [Flavobacterium sp. JAS]|nr:DUF4962 domain-containing protein [Flavobacterium sp. JAS]